jgi:DNA-binding PadR family transcriptional regulator
MTLSSLELMLLVLVDEGLQTPYALKGAGFSIGSTQPALGRLVERNLLARGKEASRRRMEYALTRAGRKAKTEGLRSLSNRLTQQQPVEELLRSCALALYAGKRSEVAKVLGAARPQAKGGRTPKYPSKQDLVAQYSWLRACVEHRVLQAHAEALVQIAGALKRSGS